MIARPVILFIACSLDGFIARADGGIDWLSTGGDYGYRTFFDAVDTILIGRKTWEMSLGFGVEPYEGRDVIVFTSTPERFSHEWASFTAESAREVVESLRKNPGGSIWLIGGGELVRSCLEDDLIDEYRIFVHPIILGGGLPLFPPHERETKLKLTGHQSFPNGLLEMRYERP